LFYRFKSLEKMKKLVFAFAAVVAVSFAACGNKTEQAAPVDTDSIVEVVDTAAEVVDSAAVADSAAVVDSAAVAE
jgi:Skp family chaperone for outer membrane proteins